jgi:acyl-CoA synthetase (AMP-forming)/AMP-acid ligase II
MAGTSLLLTALAQGRASVEVGGERLRGDELVEAVGRVAAAVRGTRRVAVAAWPSVDTLVQVAGVIAGGATAVPVHPDATERERAYILADAGVDLELHGVPSGPSAAVDGVAVDDSEALVLYTSGSTGRPKGVPITRRAIEANLDALRAAWLWDEQDVVSHALPFFHVHGLVFGGLGPLRIGSPLVHTGRFFRPVADATVYFGVPAVWAALKKEHLRELRGARLLTSGAGALQQKVFDRVEACSGHRLVNRYAMTETLVITSPGLDRPKSPKSVGSRCRASRCGSPRCRTAEGSARWRCAAPASSPATSTARATSTTRAGSAQGTSASGPTTGSCGCSVGAAST